MANSGYRDAKGRFIPRMMKAEDALEKDIGDKYVVSDNYEGKPSNAVGKLIEQNPHWKGKFEPKKETNYPQTGEKPIFKKVDEKFDKK
jgi:hypothetical protein